MQIPDHVFVIAVVASAHCPGLIGWTCDQADAQEDFAEKSASDASGADHEVRLLRVNIPAEVRAEMASVGARDSVEAEVLIDSYLDWLGVHLPDHDPSADGALLAAHTPTGWN